MLDSLFALGQVLSLGALASGLILTIYYRKYAATTKQPIKDINLLALRGENDPLTSLVARDLTPEHVEQLVA
jgi:hypothetical protein